MRRIILLFTIVALSAFTSAPPEVKLEYIFKVGDEYVWTQVTKQTIKQSVMGMDQTTETSYEGEFVLKIASLTPTGAKIETTFKKLKNETKSAAANVLMDSEGDTSKTENKIFRLMMDKPFFMYMDKRGVIEKIENVENLWSGFKNLGLDERTMTAMQQSMEQLMGKNALKGNMEQAFIPYPDKKIKQGDTWKSTTKAPLNFPLNIENTWTLSQVEGTTAKLLADGNYVTTDKEKTISLPGGFNAKMDLGGQNALKGTVNVKTGWPTNLSMLSELKGKMTLLAGGMVPEDMDIPMEITSESSLTIVKK
jgi:hypothetical protein